MQSRFSAAMQSVDHRLVAWGAVLSVALGGLIDILADPNFQAALPTFVTGFLPSKGFLHTLGTFLIYAGPVIAAIRAHYPRKTGT